MILYCMIIQHLWVYFLVLFHASVFISQQYIPIVCLHPSLLFYSWSGYWLCLKHNELRQQAWQFSDDVNKDEYVIDTKHQFSLYGYQYRIV